MRSYFAPKYQVKFENCFKTNLLILSWQLEFHKIHATRHLADPTVNAERLTDKLYVRVCSVLAEAHRLVDPSVCKTRSVP